VALRKELVDAGYDAGAETIHCHLARSHEHPPSVPTIWRVLRARGFVTSQPHKRPRSSWCRFVSELANECWHADVTHVEVADGAAFEVLNIIDDHSRVCVAPRGFVRVTSADVVRTLHKAAEKWGYPESFLSDNGLVFSAQQRHGMAGSFEMELLASASPPSTPSPTTRRIQAVSARNSASFSDGFMNPRVARGRSLRLLAMRARSRAL
jgi:transposase InsO family protein